MFIDSVSPTTEEAEEFKANVEAVTRDTPQAQVAGSRLAKALKKVGGVMGPAIRDIIVSVASEAAKKTLLGP
jgi:hypothetical protein